MSWLRDSAWRSLRDGTWLTPDRLRAYGVAGAVLSLALAASFASVIAGLGAMAAGDVDFVAFHAAAGLALEGRPMAAWDLGQHAAARAASLGAPSREYMFLHPPPFLLLVLPFGLLPFFAAFFVWTALGFGAVALTLRAWGLRGGLLLAALLSPAAIINAAHGQTGFLMLFALALVGISLDRRPWLAGIGLAILALKPQFGLLVLPALLAARRDGAILRGAVVLGLFVAASVLTLGPEAWSAFVAQALRFQGILRDAGLDPWKLQSVAGFAMAAGLGGAAAGALQAVVGLGAVAAVTLALRRRPGARAEAAAMAAGLPLVTPYIMMYDMTFLLLPMAWIVVEARRGGFLPWEGTLLAVVLAWPGVVLFVGLGLGLSATAPLAAALLAAVLRRIWAQPIGGSDN